MTDVVVSERSKPFIPWSVEGFAALVELLSASLYVGVVVPELWGSELAAAGFALTLAVSALLSRGRPQGDVVIGVRVVAWAGCSVPAVPVAGLRVLIAGAAFGAMAGVLRRALYRGKAPRFQVDPEVYAASLPGRLAESAALTGIVAGHILMLFSLAFLRATASRFRVAWFDALPFLAVTASLVFAVVVRRLTQPILDALRSGPTGDPPGLRRGLRAAERTPTHLAFVNFGLWTASAVTTTLLAPEATAFSPEQLSVVGAVALLFGSGVAIHQRAFQRSILVPALKRLRAWAGSGGDAPETLRTRLVVDFTLPVVSVCLLFLLATLALHLTVARERGPAASWLEIAPIVAACLVVTVAATTLTVRSADDLARPIDELAEATGRVAAGAIDQPLPPLAGPREIVALAASAEQMRTSLAHTIADLAAERASLERRVEDRARELRQALDDLQRAQAALVHNEKMVSLGQLVANVAHEINNPLSAVKGALSAVPALLAELREALTVTEELLALVPPEPRERAKRRLAVAAPEDALTELAAVAELVDRASSRAARIVDGLRRFSRSSESAVPASLEEGVDETLAILGPSLRERAVTVERDFGGLEPLVCHAGELNQVFLNLLANALSAVAEADVRRIRITTRQDGTVQVVTFEDSGTGVPVALRSRIFEPFFTTKPARGGTGLGLFISRQIVARHGGDLAVGDGELGGARFTVRLPAP